jgi:hypothetical protein
VVEELVASKEFAKFSVEYKFFKVIESAVFIFVIDDEL